LLVSRKKRVIELETLLSRVSGELTPLQSQLESTFGAEEANKIYRSFLEGLDNYKKGSPPQGTYVDGLISSAELGKCLATSSAADCKAKWTSEIRAYADTFFSKDCRIVASGANRKNCKNISIDFKDSMAKAIASSLIEVPPQTPSNGQCFGRTNAANEKSKSVFAFFERLMSTMSISSAFAADDEDLCGGIRADIPSPPVVAPVVCSDDNCAPSGSSAINDANKGPEKTFTTPGQAQTGTVSGTDDRPTVPVGTGSGGTNYTVGGSGGGTSGGSSGESTTTSPLPVRRVDSVTDGQSFADDQYRRATGIVGSATRGLEKVRDSILPRAEAGDRDRSRSSTRLDLSEKFIPFRPGESKSLSVSIDNPFSKRSIASISDIKGSTVGNAGSSPDSGSGAAAAASSSDGGKTALGSKGKLAGAAASRNSGDGRVADGSSSAGLASGSGGANRSLAASQDKGKILSEDSKKDVLDGLFKLPYREIESRLNRIEVIEALIGAKISVQDAKGRLLGSRRAKEKYLFAGFEKPLRRKD
jgi:hypothetical protein